MPQETARAPLRRPTRAAGLEQLEATELDVLVVGGGITGAGIALDAAARGLRVALVERDDLAKGTSSRSSSLVHGGLRYLRQGSLGLTRQSARERDLLRRLAPHLVRPQSFVLCDPPARSERALLRLGLSVYDGIAGFRAPHRHRRLDPAEVAALLPALPAARSGLVYADCVTDDARLVLSIARTAERLGALVLTRAEAVELRTLGGRVVGATVRDHISGQAIAARARWTVAAPGVWTDELRALAGPAPPMLRPSKGVHLVFPAAALPLRAAALVPSAVDDGRLLFAVPWSDDGDPTHGHVMVGTTDERYDGPLDAPTVTAEDADYCCAAVNALFGTALRPSDAVGAWAGLRPLLRAEGDREVGSDKLSRRHAVVRGPDGLLAITGGKLTTYRAMAAEVIDEVAHTIGGAGTRRSSPTARIRLGLRGAYPTALARVRDLCSAWGLDPGLAAHLVQRHGDEAGELVAAAVRRGEAEPLVAGLPYLRAEARWAVERELALGVEDVLRRRLRVAVRDAAGGGPAAEDVAAMLAAAHGAQALEAAGDAEAYRRAVAAERGAVPLADRQPARG